MPELPYAEEVNYWKTSRASPDSWMEKSKSQIEKLGGSVITEAFGSDVISGRSAYVLCFIIEGRKFKAMWPVLPTRGNKEEKAARVQAATMLYHDIKSKCLASIIKGSRSAFFEYLLLPDGRTTVEATEKELMQGVPDVLLSMGQ